MEELVDLIAKLDKLSFIEERNKELKTKEGFSMYLSTKLHKSSNEVNLPSIQAILYVKYERQQVAFWGCCNREEEVVLIDWFLSKQNIAKEYEFEEESRLRKVGEFILNTL